MMSEVELRAWRELERERLDSLVSDKARDRCSHVVMLLTAVLQDD